MRGGCRSSRRRTTMRLRDEPSTNVEDNVDSQENESVDLQQEEDNSVPQSQEQQQEESDSMGRMRVTVADDRIQPSEPCSRGKIFKLKLDEQGASYKLVSSDTKKFYFEEFKKHFVWDAAINALVEKSLTKRPKPATVTSSAKLRTKRSPLTSHKLLGMNGIGGGRALR